MFVEALSEYQTARFTLYANLSECITILRRHNTGYLPESISNLTSGDAAERLITGGDMVIIQRILQDADRIYDDL